MQTMSVSTPACQSVSRARTLGGRIFIPAPAQHVSDAADRVQQLPFVRFVDLAAQARDGDVDDIVEGRGPCRRVPHIAHEHLPRHDAPPVAQEVFEDVEFLRGQVKGLRSPRHFARDQIHLQILVLQFEDLIHAPPA